VQFVRIHCPLSPIAAVIAATHGRPRGCLLTGGNSSHTILRNGPFGKVPRRKAEGGMAMGYLPQFKNDVFLSYRRARHCRARQRADRGDALIGSTR